MGILLILAQVVANGCKKAEAPPPPAATQKAAPAVAAATGDTIARIHWLGKNRLAAETNAAYFMSLWNMPESALLEAQTLDKLALALGLGGDKGGSGASKEEPGGVNPEQSTNLDTDEAALFSQLSITNVTVSSNLLSRLSTLHSQVNSNPAASLLRPLLEDLVNQEWYVEVRQGSNQPAEAGLALRLDEQRARLWETNLAALGGGNWSGISNRLSPTTRRAGGWTVVGFSGSESSLAVDFVDRIGRDGVPFAGFETNSWMEADAALRRVRTVTGPDSWLKADVDLGRVAPIFGLRTNLPKLTLSVIGEGQIVHTEANAEFQEPLGVVLEPWNIPTNLIHDPLIGFMAIRGFRSWLAEFKPWNDLQLGTPPDQAYFWAQYGLPSFHFTALPSPDASNQVCKLTDYALNEVNPVIASNRIGTFQVMPDGCGLHWKGVPWMSPSLAWTDDGGNPFIVAGLSPHVRSNSPPRAELLEQLSTSTNLVCYDWEFSGLCSQGLGQMAQLARHVFRRSRMTGTLGLRWAATLAPKLGNAVTVVKLLSPTRLSLTRSSSMGCTGFELQVIADWLESPDFPIGLHTLNSPIPPPSVQPPTPEPDATTNTMEKN